MSKNSRTPAEIEETALRMGREIEAVKAEMQEIQAEMEKHVRFIDGAGISDDERERHRAAVAALLPRAEKLGAKLRSLGWEGEGIAQELEALAKPGAGA
jgi:hypothetical protein